jgi:hypothetical protein
MDYLIVYTILTAWYFYNVGYNAAVADVKATGRIPELED